MPKAKLTKRVVDAAIPKQQRYVIYDTVLSGFGLRVYPSGRKSWIFDYRPGDGGRNTPKKRITIGRAEDFTPAQARKIAEGYKAKVRMGIDPQAEKMAARKSLTVAELAEIFLKAHVAPKRKASTYALYEDILTRLVVPKIGRLKAKDVKRTDIARLHLEYRDNPYQANRMLAVISSMYGFAGKQGLVSEDCNPARKIERYKEKGRERFLSVEELERLGAAIRKAETEGIDWQINPNGKMKHVPKRRRKTVIDQHAAAALRLLIFTGARVGEILNLKWEHVDFERGLLLLPDSKSGKKTIVLNAPALEVLVNLPRIGSYVIAGETAGQKDEKPRKDLKRPWKAVRQEAGLEDLRLHDLRHNFAAFGAGGGLGLPIIGKLLGHKQPQTTARYAHLDADPLRKAANAIGERLVHAMGEHKDAKEGNQIQKMKQL